MKKTDLKTLQNYFGSYKYKCKSGCFECCTSIDFSVEEKKFMDKELTKNGFIEPPNGKGNKHCEYLTEQGKCSVYNSRPIVCRAFSDLKVLLKLGNQQAFTQSCSYGKSDIYQEAPFVFMKYLGEINEKGIKNKNYFLK